MSLHVVTKNDDNDERWAISVDLNCTDNVVTSWLILLYHFNWFGQGCDLWHSGCISTFGPLALWFVTNRIINQNFDRFFLWRGIQHLFPGCQWVLDILLMIVVSRVDVNKFLNHDQKILKAVFLNHFSHVTKVNVMCCRYVSTVGHGFEIVRGTEE